MWIEKQCDFRMKCRRSTAIHIGHQRSVFWHTIPTNKQTKSHFEHVIFIQSIFFFFISDCDGESLFGFSISLLFFGAGLVCFVWFFYSFRKYSSYLSSKRCCTHSKCWFLQSVVGKTGTACRLCTLFVSLFKLVVVHLLNRFSQTYFFYLALIPTNPIVNVCLCLFIALFGLLCFCIIFQIHQIYCNCKLGS